MEKPKQIKRNPKQEGSSLWDCKPQVGRCPINCHQCFYNRPNAFYMDINKPCFPTTEEVGDGIVRVNCGHDSNIERLQVIKETEQYRHRFFNTSLPKFDFPAPVVFTANKEEERAACVLDIVPLNMMYIRLRVSSTNLHHIDIAVQWYAKLKRVPIVLTFMAYYDQEPKNKGQYIWKKRHINSYWCATPAFIISVLQRERKFGGRLITMCGTPSSNWCRDCRNCETYYWQTARRIEETKQYESCI